MEKGKLMAHFCAMFMLFTEDIYTINILAKVEAIVSA